MRGWRRRRGAQTVATVDAPAGHVPPDPLRPVEASEYLLIRAPEIGPYVYRFDADAPFWVPGHVVFDQIRVIGGSYTLEQGKVAHGTLDASISVSPLEVLIEERQQKYPRRGW